MNEHKEKLMAEFPPVTTKEWEDKIYADLKGADYQKKLIWNTGEGFDIKPYYRNVDLEGVSYLNGLPGEAPYLRGNSSKGNDWEICQDIETSDPAESNVLALDAIHRGATGINFSGSEIETIGDLQLLLKGIPLTSTSLHFSAVSNYPHLVRLLVEYLDQLGIRREELKGSFDFDPLSYVLTNGEFWEDQESDLAEVVKMVTLGKELLPSMKVITINGQYLNSAGASIVQELAFSLASGNEYLATVTEAGIPVDDVAPRMKFNFGTGSDYFPEIARLRAARLLWSKIVEQYHPSGESSGQMSIHSITSAWNKTLYDPYVNILRTTTESMSAILGGTQSLAITPFDTFYKDPDEFSTRIARNQQVILKEEAYLDKVVDPSAGSYYIENLTDAIASEAWKLFQVVEEMGGMTACIKAGFIQDETEKTANQKANELATRRHILLGTNQYPNLDEKVLDNIQAIDESEEPEEEELTTYKTLKLRRAADDFDDLRLATEVYESEGNKRPSVFLLPIGNLGMSKARAMFSTNFLGCAGYEVIDNLLFDSVDEGVKAAEKSGAEIVVICSSDEEYAELAVPITTRLKATNDNTIVLVAGYPKEILEELKAAGVDEFVHIRSNLFETLTKFQVMLGISE